MSNTSASAPTHSVRPFLRLASGYWGGKSKGRAWLLTALVLTAAGAQIGSQVAINAWNRLFFDSLERKDVGAIWEAVYLLLLLVPGAAASVTMLVVLRLLLQASWRKWVTDEIAGWWIADQRYYRLTLVAPEQTVPEYRISDDVRLAIEPLVEFSIGLLSALVTALTFAGILWSVAGDGHVVIGGTTIVIPAYMAVAAVVYAVLASLAALAAGRPLVAKVAAKNEAEAQFRAEMTRLRENAESIALIKGDRDELASVRRRYGGVFSAWLNVIRQQGIIGVVLNTNGALFPIVPLLLITPKYLAGELTMGAVVQVVAAFGAVQGALIWFVDNSVRLSEWFASATRVVELTNTLDELDVATQMDNDTEIRFEPSPDSDMHLENLSIADRAGKTVIANTNISITKGEKVLITGESGVGKTTLIRALAGLWPWGSGIVKLPPDTALTFIPQRPYLPLGPLRAAVCYPEDPGSFSDEAVHAAMKRCGLGYLIKKLDDEEQRWDSTLSGGERQRLAFCRILLNRPGIIIMDEATSALDEDSQTSLLSLLHEDLQQCTVISVGHRSGLEEFHGRKIILERRVAGARFRDVALPTSLWRLLKGSAIRAQ